MLTFFLCSVSVVRYVVVIRIEYNVTNSGKYWNGMLCENFKQTQICPMARFDLTRLTRHDTSLHRETTMLRMSFWHTERQWSHTLRYGWSGVCASVFVLYCCEANCIKIHLCENILANIWLRWNAQTQCVVSPNSEWSRPVSCQSYRLIDVVTHHSPIDATHSTEGSQSHHTFPSFELFFLFIPFWCGVVWLKRLIVCFISLFEVCLVCMWLSRLYRSSTLPPYFMYDDDNDDVENCAVYENVVSRYNNNELNCVSCQFWYRHANLYRCAYAFDTIIFKNFGTIYSRQHSTSQSVFGAHFNQSHKKTKRDNF